MKRLIFSVMVVALTTLTFTSCENFDLFDKDWDKEGYCDFVYPFDMVLPSDEIITVNNEEEFDAVYENWERDDIESEKEIAISYPIQVNNSKGETVTVVNDEELEAAFEDCRDKKDDCDRDCDDDYDDDKEDCFDYVYPITMTMPDGTIVTGNDEDALKLAVDNWFTANSNSTGEAAFVYPIQIIYEDGTTETINDDDELKAAYEDCD